MKQINGNLLDMADSGIFDVIIHGCNCWCTMGAGIAKQIKDRYPGAYLADSITEMGNIKKLGYFTSYVHSNNFVIINAYTQVGFSLDTINVNYDAIKNVMRSINNIYKGCKIGIPKIGAGLAGGDWKIISNIIDNEMLDVDLTLVIYDGY